MQSIGPDVEGVMKNLEDVFGVTVLRENVSALLDESLAELGSWEERKKAALKALNAQFAEERDALRERTVVEPDMSRMGGLGIIPSDVAH